MEHLVYPSLLSADLGNLQKMCEMINKSAADGFHLDVMDGIFVPNIALGFPLLQTIKKYAEKPLDVHLMISHPDKYIGRCRDIGADILTIHIETCPFPEKTLLEIRNSGMKTCMAINPDTPVQLLKEFLNELDSVCVMSVYPGFGGQLFLENTYSRLQELTEMATSNRSIDIKVDGGVSLFNYRKLLDCGTKIIVAGTAVFGEQDPTLAIRKLKK